MVDMKNREIIEERNQENIKRCINISSRKSDLALVQTNQVKDMLQKIYPSYDFEIGLQDTTGDQILDKHLADLGTSIDSGLFTKSLEKELLEKRSRFAVHSLKDMPTKLPQGLILACICKRENPEDAVIIHPKHKIKGILKLEDLPAGSIIGTSSLRRESLVLNLFPGLTIKTIRGNIQTRLKKLDEADDYDAIIVAAAGFRRGGLVDRIDQTLDPSKFGYGVGQGSIGIECREDDEEIIEMLRSIEHEESAQLCKAERSLLYHIEGGCQISMGVNSSIAGNQIFIEATLLSQDGKKKITEKYVGERSHPEEIGIALARKFLENPDAVFILGKRGEKRALTYGDIEAPGDAAAEALKKAKVIDNSS